MLKLLLIFELHMNAFIFYFGWELIFSFKILTWNDFIFLTLHYTGFACLIINAWFLFLFSETLWTGSLEKLGSNSRRFSTHALLWRHVHQQHRIFLENHQGTKGWHTVHHEDHACINSTCTPCHVINSFLIYIINLQFGEHQQ